METEWWQEPTAMQLAEQGDRNVPLKVNSSHLLTLAIPENLVIMQLFKLNLEWQCCSQISAKDCAARTYLEGITYIHKQDTANILVTPQKGS